MGKRRGMSANGRQLSTENPDQASSNYLRKKMERRERRRQSANCQ